MNARLTPQNRLQAEDLLEEFRQQFPNTFFNPALSPLRPLKLKIHEDIWQTLENQHSRKAISRACTLYVNMPEYQSCLTPGAVRVDLAGQPCGEVTDEQAQWLQHPQSRYQRFQKRLQRLEQRALRAAEPNIEAEAVDSLANCRLDLVVKMTVLPACARTVANGWQEFLVESDGHVISITIRPKVWKKLQYTAATCRYWIATIRGKKGANLEHNGFELRDPLVQIFERQASEYEISQNSNESQMRRSRKPYLTDPNSSREPQVSASTLHSPHSRNGK